MKKFLEKFDGKSTFRAFHQNRPHIGRNSAYCKAPALLLIFLFRWIFVDIFWRINKLNQKQQVNIFFFIDSVMKLMILLNTPKTDIFRMF